MNSAVITTRAVGKRYRQRWALADCTLSVPEGSVTGLVGPNGAGKSTLIHLVTGRLRPSAGTLDVFGARPASSARQLADVGFVAQNTPVYAHFSVADHLRFGAHMNARWDARFAAARIEELALDPRQRAGRLSGGQRAQLSLTLALAKRPRILVLDEPVASLDPLARRGFLDTLREAVADSGTTVILSSHLIGDLEPVCDHLIVLTGGRVRLAGPVRSLLVNHRADHADGAGEAGLEELVLFHLDRAANLAQADGDSGTAAER